MSAIVDTLKFLRLVYRQRVTGFVISDQPAFDKESLPFFLSSLKDSKVYLEYGSGGSTLLAASMSKTFLSVESDRFYLASVKDKVSEKYPHANGIFLHGDIGPTKQWGNPIFQKQTGARLKKWLNYAEAPWHHIKQNALPAPDLILIDGRFRVCCALVSIRNLPPQSECTLLIDDYAERPNYRIVEQYASLIQMHGRMAVFKADVALNSRQLDEAIEHYKTDLT